MYSTGSLLRWTATLLASTTAVYAAPAQHAPALHPRADFNILVGGNVSLRIMPLGASITYGLTSSDGNGYRKVLRDLLVADGNPVDMVGNHPNGTMEDNDNEGWPGFRIEQVLAKAKISVPTTLPNLVLINAGTNDCVQNYDIANAHVRMLEMMDYIWDTSKRATIVLSTLLVNGNNNTETCVLNVNEQFKKLAAEQQALSKKVVLVDMHSDKGPLKSDLVDGTHPSDAGYAKMASIWFDGIKDAAARGWLESPQPLPDSKKSD
ncbi:GDSL-like Lipase/Acylhydrolase [Colletotrichum orchidophilum]|uniref:GDSL-like Lipase/Acylhydrolase n=1 Tax=Colletotrichum orchidophilum TaxID=1209926 RepID=A0A1G4B0J8_9PEZI|nr:GDSL-like Lipase/Acylhydrolase [Colletotrichum orchidophilum]OHE94914.1 GDSL-like Lipase/Acylhydrolase [Colletotrichum orchidophilum]